MHRNSTATAADVGTYAGDMTYYDAGLGACGVQSASDAPVVALSEILFDPQTPNGNPNNNPLCGQFLTAYYGDSSIRLVSTSLSCRWQVSNIK